MSRSEPCGGGWGGTSGHGSTASETWLTTAAAAVALPDLEGAACAVPGAADVIYLRSIPAPEGSAQPVHVRAC